MAAATETLVERYQLQEEDLNSQITDKHLDKISHSHCSQWRRLPPYLGMESIVRDDVNRLSASEEEEKRCAFFLKWKDMKGSEATYQRLISALLEMECTNDAEKVCKLFLTLKGRDLPQ